MFAKLHTTGFLDVNEVANEQERVLYVTRPAAFSKFGDPFVDDAMDLAKALVTCLTYGITRRDPGTGRIQLIRALLRKLIAGEWVGSATAIGQDYKVLELKRVVQIRHARGTRYDMRLLKREVGIIAMEVLTAGEATEAPLAEFVGEPISIYVGPEQTRAARRKGQNKQSKRGTMDIITALRMGK